MVSCMAESRQSNLSCDSSKHVNLIHEGSILRTSSNLNHLPKIPPPRTITIWATASTFKFWGDTNIHSISRNSCPLNRWCHPTISSSVVPFSSCLESFPASGSFQMSQFFASGGQKYWSFSFSISPSSEYSGLISFRIDWLDLLEVQGTLKFLSNTTVQKNHFFGTQLSL